MKKKLMLCALAAALGLSSAFSLAFAQADWSAAPSATAAPQSGEAKPDQPSESGLAPERTAAAGETVGAGGEAAGETVGAGGEAAGETVQAEIAEETKPEPEPEPVQVVEETPAEVPAEAPEPPKKAKAPKEEGESCDGMFGIGVRGAVGVSAFQGHRAIYTPSFGNLAIILGPSVSASAGISFVFNEASFISYSVDALYSVYKARGEFSVKTNGADFGRLNEAGVELHTLDVPILARLNIGSRESRLRFYAELGPQVGANLYGRIFANSELKKPYLNTLAFGPAAGLGIIVNGAIVGVRGYFNALEYAENSDGRPWAVQAGVTTYCLKF